uniref:G-protein coupled receptors family 1 profile domain-containing protein n=1 Tax=Biomphalaria glabrata TaxID=6526 RepID=A0A2C9KYI8_BIOGL
MNNSTYCPEGVRQVDITSSRIVTIALAVTCSVLAACTCVTNLTVILALCRLSAQSPRTGLHTSGRSNSPPCHILIVSMSVTDAIIGFINIPIGIYVIGKNGSWVLGKELCFFYIWLDKVLCTVSIYHVALMALDRYIAICKPLLYRLMSKKTTLTLVALSWLFPTTISTILMSGGWHHSDIDWLLSCAELVGICTPIYQWSYLIVVSILDFFMPFLVIFVLYFLVTVEICRLDKKPISRGTVSTNSKAKQKSRVGFIQRLGHMTQRAHSGDGIELQRRLPRKVNTDGDKCNDAKGATLERILKSVNIGNTDEPLKANEGTLTSLSSDLGTNTEEQSKQELVLSDEQESGARDTDTIIFDSIAHNFKALRTGNSKSKNQNLICEMRKGFKNAKRAPSCVDASDDKELSLTKSDIAIFTVSSPNYICPGSNGAVNGGSLQKYVISAESAKRKSRDKPEASSSGLRSNQQIKTSKAFTTIGCVVVCFTVCWLPFSVYNFAHAYSGYKMATWPHLLFSWMGYLNSAMNPFFYCFTRSVRQAILAMLRLSKPRR